MIVDACIFAGEMDMLEFRLKVLWPVVDKFIVIEGDKTFAGQPRARTDLTRLDWAKDKLLSNYVTLRGNSPWPREHSQRNSIKVICSQYGPFDLLMMSDVDEIPSREAVEQIKQNPVGLPKTFFQAAFMYDLKHFADDYWCGTIVMTMAQMKKSWPQVIRDRRGAWTRIPNAGWHCTYFGGVSGIQNKLRSFSHQEFNTPAMLDEKYLTDCISTGKNLLGRAATVTMVGPEFFPEYVVENAKQYGWLS